MKIDLEENLEWVAHKLNHSSVVTLPVNAIKNKYVNMPYIYIYQRQDRHHCFKSEGGQNHQKNV